MTLLPRLNEEIEDDRLRKSEANVGHCCAETGARNMIQEILGLLLVTLSINAQLDVKDDCRLPNGTTGECVLVNNCPSALALISNRQKPKLCGFQGKDTVVCCEKTPLAPTLRKSLKFCDESQLPKPPADASSAVGSVDALPQEFLHMASLGYGDTLSSVVWGCGGSLISYNFVLTAAHCLSNRNLGIVKFVRLGDLNLKLYGEPAEPQDFTAARIIKHPEYKSPAKYHDIALIELDRRVKLSPYVRPACLYSEKQNDGNIFVATGWGNLGFNGQQASHLQKVYLLEVPIDKCREFYEENVRTLSRGIVGDLQICAGDMLKDTCQGDSGGPLQRKNDNYSLSWNIHGVVSFGKACGLSRSPGIYTRVSNYIDWIESIVWPNGSFAKRIIA